MGYYKNWMTKDEKQSKKDYIAISRRIVKRLLTNNFIERIPNCQIDHQISLEACWSVHLNILIANSTVNLKNIPKDVNLRKGNRNYLDIQSLIELYHSQDNRGYLKLMDSLENKWGVDFDSYSKIIKV
jgi:hypothetical protein